jgi:hypothetical protein
MQDSIKSFGSALNPTTLVETHSRIFSRRIAPFMSSLGGHICILHTEKKHRTAQIHAYVPAAISHYACLFKNLNLLHTSGNMHISRYHLSIVAPFLHATGIDTMKKALALQPHLSPLLKRGLLGLPRNSPVAARPQSFTQQMHTSLISPWPPKMQ